MLDLADHLIRSFINLTQAHYSRNSDDRCTDTVLTADMIFVLDDMINSSIWVTDQYPEQEELSEGKPRVVVRRGRMQFSDMAVTNNLESMNLFEGSHVEMSLVPCSVVLQCLSADGLEAEAIAFDVAAMIRVTAPEIYTRTKIHDINAVVIGEEQPLEIKGAKTEWAAVPVEVSCTVNYQLSVGLRQPEQLRGFDENMTF